VNQVSPYLTPMLAERSVRAVEMHREEQPIHRSDFGRCRQTSYAISFLVSGGINEG
jgi:hypothetical protein